MALLSLFIAETTIREITLFIGSAYREPGGSFPLLFYLYHMKNKGRMNLDNKEFLFLAMYSLLLSSVIMLSCTPLGMNDTMLMYT